MPFTLPVKTLVLSSSFFKIFHVVTQTFFVSSFFCQIQPSLWTRTHFMFQLNFNFWKRNSRWNIFSSTQKQVSFLITKLLFSTWFWISTFNTNFFSFPLSCWWQPVVFVWVLRYFRGLGIVRYYVDTRLLYYLLH